MVLYLSLHMFLYQLSMGVNLFQNHQAYEDDHHGSYELHFVFLHLLHILVKHQENVLLCLTECHIETEFIQHFEIIMEFKNV